LKAGRKDMKELDSYDNLLKISRKKSNSRQQKLKKAGLRPADLKGIPLDLLMHDDPKMRLKGISELLKSYHPKTMRILSRLQKLELDPTVKETISNVLSTNAVEQTENQADAFFVSKPSEKTEDRDLDSFFSVSDGENSENDSGGWQERVLAVEDAILRHTEEIDTKTSLENVTPEKVRKNTVLIINISYRFFLLLLFIINGGIAFFFFEAGFSVLAMIFVFSALVVAKGAGSRTCP
jgi:hypothetical protein